MRYFDQSKSMLTDWYTRSMQQGLCSGLPSSSGVICFTNTKFFLHLLLMFWFCSLLFDDFDISFSLILSTLFIFNSSFSIILVALPGATRPHGLGTWNPMQCSKLVSNHTSLQPVFRFPYITFMGIRGSPNPIICAYVCMSAWRKSPNTIVKPTN